MPRWFGCSVLALLLGGAAHAHFHMFLPATPSAKVGQEVVFTLQFGHPFEHQLFDCTAPRRIHIQTPDGKKVSLEPGVTDSRLRKVSVPGDGGKKVSAYEFRYSPKARGDHVLVVEMPPVWDGEEKAFFEDVVKVVLHVQAQKGWDAVLSRDFEWEPLTRPYGLEPGMVFQARLELLEPGERRMVYNPWRGLVEIERYNATPPAKLPPALHMTRTAKTSPAGIVTTTLTDPGWWSLSATQNTTRYLPGDKGKGSYRVKRRSTLWVHVDRKPGTK